MFHQSSILGVYEPIHQLNTYTVSRGSVKCPIDVLMSQDSPSCQLEDRWYGLYGLIFRRCAPRGKGTINSSNSLPHLSLGDNKLAWCPKILRQPGKNWLHISLGRALPAINLITIARSPWWVFGETKLACCCWSNCVWIGNTQTDHFSGWEQNIDIE